jgi:ADP-dependent NAD(P)H-hydrate dehydratase / NAD(P)H-hydrate epimerase
MIILHKSAQKRGYQFMSSHHASIEASTNAQKLWIKHFPTPKREAHKYARGHVLVRSGGMCSTGAARLAAKAALRIGAGVVSVLSPSEALIVNANHLTAIMLKPCNNADDLKQHLEDSRVRALVLGPAGGVGEALRQEVEAACSFPSGLVLDADALTSFADQWPRFLDVLHHKKGDAPVLTPHEGEFARLFHTHISYDLSREVRVLKASTLTQSVIVLKGNETLIASPDGRLVKNINGSPRLATAGSGDVLSGIIAGLVAQGMPAFAAACAGVWCHAQAAQYFGAGLIAEDLPELIPQVLKELYTSFPTRTD